MLAQFDNTLIIKLNKSRALVAVLVVLHLGAVLILVVVPLAPPLRLLLLALTGISLYRTLPAHGLRRGRGAVCVLEMGQDEGLALRRCGQDEWLDVSLLGTFVHPCLVVLRLRLPDRRFPVGVLIPADAVDAEPFRHLRARLNLRNRGE